MNCVGCTASLAFIFCPFQDIVETQLLSSQNSKDGAAAAQSRILRKDPLRMLRYIGFLLKQELVRGDANRRRRFLARILWRCERVIGIYSIAKLGFLTLHAWRGVGLKPDERRRKWRHCRWMWAIYGLSNHDYLETWISERLAHTPKIMVIGMGSIGDVLQITPVLRALREKLPNAEICLLHRCAAAKTILHKNPYVNSVAWADFYTFLQIKRAVSISGGADVVLDIECAKYLVTYTRAPAPTRFAELDKILPDEFFQKADAARSVLVNAPTAIVQADGSYTRSPEWKPYHFLDVLGATANLPIDRNSKLDFVLEPSDFAVSGQLPKDRRYIVVQNGVDLDVVNWGRSVGQRPTKLLPLLIWEDVVRRLQAKGWYLVQLGAAHDDAIQGVDCDLRGKTTLREAAVILKGAACHLGTEGGLTHLARAMETRGVIMFGATSVDFFGYPNNINLTTGGCSSCWLSTKDWYVYCPRNFCEPACMASHSPNIIADQVAKLSA